jgi:hypothetical protein
MAVSTACCDRTAAPIKGCEVFFAGEPAASNDGQFGTTKMLTVHNAQNKDPVAEDVPISDVVVPIVGAPNLLAEVSL